MPDENKSLIRGVIEEVWNGGDLAAVDRYFAPDYVDHAHLPGQAPCPEGYRADRRDPLPRANGGSTPYVAAPVLSSPHLCTIPWRYPASTVIREAVVATSAAAKSMLAPLPACSAWDCGSRWAAPT